MSAEGLEELGEEVPASAVSFFADDDEAACDAIFAMYLKDSRGRGFAPAQTIDERADNSNASPQEENEMSSNAEVKDNVLRTYRALARELGRPPSNVEIIAAMGDELPQETDDGKAWKVGACRRELVAAGLAEKAKKGVKAGSLAKTKPNTKVAPKTQGERPAGAEVARPEDPIITVIRSEAAVAAARLEMLTRMLDALEG